MKKLSIAVAMILGMGVTASQAAETGTLSFTGNVVTSTCGIDASSLATTVAFGSFAENTLLSLPNVGATSPELTKPVSIKLVDCPAGAPISVKFEGAYNGDIQGFADNQPGDTNVGVMVFDAGTSTKVLPNEFVSKGVTVAGANELKYDLSLTRWWTGGNSTAKKSFSIPISYTMSYQ